MRVFATAGNTGSRIHSEPATTHALKLVRIFLQDCMQLRAGLLCVLPVIDAYAIEHPHILYITVDDLGWKDIGYHGSTVQTPTLDRLAAAGARLEQFYVQPFSSQTRAAVTTGRYPMRYGMQTMQIQSFSRFGVPADERLLPKVLKEAGYGPDDVARVKGEGVAGYRTALGRLKEAM